MMVVEQQPTMKAAAAEQRYQHPQWPSVGHCNDVNKVLKHKGDVLTGELSTRPDNPYQDHPSFGG